MLSDPELNALIQQAARNLDTLTQLASASGHVDPIDIRVLRERLDDLKRAYTIETDALTREVLHRAVERRTRTDRRQRAAGS